jgi:hypothetical protein
MPLLDVANVGYKIQTKKNGASVLDILSTKMLLSVHSGGLSLLIIKLQYYPNWFGRTTCGLKTTHA